MTGKTEDELRKYGYAPGDYSCKCTMCEQEFTGDKRAGCCEPCARNMIASYAISNVATTNTVNTKQATPFTIDDIFAMKAKIDATLESIVGDQVEKIVAAGKILDNFTILPSPILARSEMLLHVSPEVYDELVRRAKSDKPA